jgi:beta-N-acetylhexosaminidase
MSDDLGMKALSGTMQERAKAVIEAGSDLALVCSGDLSDTEAVAEAVPHLAGDSLARFQRACGIFRQQEPFDVAEARSSLEHALRAGA